jgi:hypothetical protein
MGTAQDDSYWCEWCERVHSEAIEGRVDHGDTQWGPSTCEEQADEYRRHQQECDDYILQVRSDWMDGKRLR